MPLQLKLLEPYIFLSKVGSSGPVTLFNFQAFGTWMRREENGRDLKVKERRKKNPQMGTHRDMNESNLSIKYHVDLGRQHQNQIKGKEESPNCPTCIWLNREKLAHLTTFPLGFTGDPHNRQPTAWISIIPFYYLIH